jgi:hypothetical protein
MRGPLVGGTLDDAHAAARSFAARLAGEEHAGPRAGEEIP